VRVHFASAHMAAAPVCAAAAHSFLQFFTPNRERRLLTVYPGARASNADEAAHCDLDAQPGAAARQSAAAAHAAGDRFAVDWSGQRAIIESSHFLHIYLSSFVCVRDAIQVFMSRRC
jgi:hypothetical protein